MLRNAGALSDFRTDPNILTRPLDHPTFNAARMLLLSRCALFPEALLPEHVSDMEATSFFFERAKPRHPTAIKGQAGNSMNVNVVGAILLYMLVWVDRVESGMMQRAMTYMV
jgi:hypothetical protein